tara:strand:- start:485 stop:655 length:171 start_codon:yes stop_codon:yes gene_type:complete
VYIGALARRSLSGPASAALEIVWSMAGTCCITPPVSGTFNELTISGTFIETNVLSF